MELGNQMDGHSDEAVHKAADIIEGSYSFRGNRDDAVFLAEEVCDGILGSKGEISKSQEIVDFLVGVIDGSVHLARIETDEATATARECTVILKPSDSLSRIATGVVGN